MTAHKYVYFFGEGKADGDAGMKPLLGGKGANLAEMTRLGIRVPPGFTISTEGCKEYYELGGRLPEGLWDQVEASMARLEQVMGKRLGDDTDPLLVSVRSGAAVSMPGMMDTVLNLGLNDRSVQGIIARSGNPRFGWDLYRRLINMYGDVVMGVAHEHFEEALTAAKRNKGVELDTDLEAEDLRALVDAYKAIYRVGTGEDFPQDPALQLRYAAEAVFKSWEVERARTYRRLHRITGLLGTAVNVQTMVFGNMGDGSGTGVCFTRDPGTGENVFYGEFLLNAQGEDVVAGIRTPEPIADLARHMPEVHGQLLEIKDRLEQHYGDVQDFEFTVQEGVLYMLQTRNGKRTGLAALRIATDMVDEGLIDTRTAVKRVDPHQLDQLLFPVLAPKAVADARKEGRLLARGLNAGPGAAAGKIALSADRAEEWAERGESVVLVRRETSPEDVGGMHAAAGILTSTGGMTSHAAVVARGMGRPCVVGCGVLDIDYREGTLSRNGKVLKEGDWITLDGTTGDVYSGRIETRPSDVVAALVYGDNEVAGSDVVQRFTRLMQWADDAREIKVRTNADTPEDSRVARALGAQGIGLCRTEHMFFQGDRIVAVREMILAKTPEARRKALDKLLPIQQGDFEGIFRAMDGLPVTVRLLDPPLHEFLPHEKENQEEMAATMGVTAEQVRHLVESLHEFNPMLGHRGCRLGVTYPEIYDMQVRAILQAAVAVADEGVEVIPEIMIPLVGAERELAVLRERTLAVAADVLKGRDLPYLVGTMIEIPRAALRAESIARHADFFSFGTNDLTQLTFGYSRDDAGSFLPAYVEQGLLPADPFQTLDQDGVGELVRLGIQRGRVTKPQLKVGICGEHGGDPDSVKFCAREGMDYVSCSPFRVPVARLAAAQAALEATDKKA